MTAQHLISKNLTMNSPKARKACEFLQVPLCLGHNILKTGDAAWARKILALRLAELIGEDWLRRYVDSVEWNKPEATVNWASIMGAQEPPEGFARA